MRGLGTDWQRADRPRRRVGRGIEAHASIGSTNDRALALLDEADGTGRAVVAEEQTAGRGRRGRAWISAPGRNLAVSVALRPRLAPADAWQLAAAAALAARAACTVHAPVSVKWPNDLVDGDGAKLGGLLLETTIGGDRVSSAVVGVGINVNWPRSEMPAELADSATSLGELAGRSIDRVVLLSDLLDALDAEILAVEAGRSPLARFRAACATLGADVVVESGGRRIEGRAVDVDERGALVIATAHGREAVTSGELARLRAAAPA